MSDFRDEFTAAFGRRLRAGREGAGLSLAEFAERAATQRAYVWRVEDGRTLPSMKTAMRLAKALGLTLSAFLEGIEQEIDQ